MKIKTVLLFILFTGFSFLKAQDFHFSQFAETPLLINPSLTGAFEGNVRGQLYFRNQWGKIMNAYETFGASVDGRISSKRNENGGLAFGFSVMKDKTGKSELATTQTLFSIAYHQRIEKHSYLSAGVQGGFTQKKISYTELLWDNQYDPNAAGFDPSLPTKESYISDGFSYSDVSGGVLYSFINNQSSDGAIDRINLRTGMAFYHFIKNDKTFTNRYNNPMYTKLVFHGKAFLGIYRSSYSLVPAFIYEIQGPNQEIVLGTSLRKSFKNKSLFKGYDNDMAVSLGYLVRTGDAFVPHLTLEFAGFKLGITYDASFNELKNYSKKVGGFEINLCYIPSIF